MEKLLILFAIQGLLEAFDTIYHHELTERLPWRRSAADQLKLRGISSFLYSIILLSLGWVHWTGIFTWALASMLGGKVIITLMFYFKEGRSRKITKIKRVTHIILILIYGVILSIIFPLLLQWSQQPTGYVIMNFGVLSWVMTLYAVFALIWGWRYLLRGVSWKKAPKNALKINTLSKARQLFLVTGGTGFIGKPLCQALLDQGHFVTVLTRDMESARSMFTGFIRLISSLDVLDNSERFDVVINLAGEPISQRWTPNSKLSILESRTETTRVLVAFLKRMIHKPGTLISGSAIGIYGTDRSITFAEKTPPSKSPVGLFPLEVCSQWEAAACKAKALGIRTCLLRTGIVLEIEGGALAKMLFPFEFGLGGPVGNGKQWFSWIHRDDLIQLIIHLINDETIDGAVNATAPEPITNKSFTRALGKVMKRPTIMALPAFHIILLFGSMGQAILLAGQRVLPKKAVESGFKFRYPTIDKALQNIFMR